MSNYYFTFGQCHVHRVNGKTFDCDTVAVISAESHSKARQKFVDLFGDKFHQSLELPPEMSYFPMGFLAVEVDRHICPGCASENIEPKTSDYRKGECYACGLKWRFQK